MDVHGKKICVTGTAGLIAGYISRDLIRAQTSDNTFYFPTRQVLDLTSKQDVEKYFKAISPDIIIHCAALTNNPACEKNPDLAYLLNVESCRWICEFCPDAWIGHFSTDLVFDGSEGAYTEESPVSPIGVYAESKAESERVFLKHSKSCIIRTSLNGGVSATGDRGFNEKMRMSWASGNSTRLFVDEYRNPIPAAVTSRAVLDIMSHQLTGIFHLCGNEKLSRFEIGDLIAKRWPGLNPKILSGSIKDYSGPPRSPDCSMQCDKIKPFLSFPLPGLSEYLSSNPRTPF